LRSQATKKKGELGSRGSFDGKARRTDDGNGEEAQILESILLSGLGSNDGLLSRREIFLLAESREKSSGV